MVPFGDCGSPKKAWALFSLFALALVSLTLASAAGEAAPTAKPTNLAEPDIDGRAEEGRTLSASRGRWTGTGPLSYAFRWVRCGANGGRPDGSDCGFILGATRSSYQVASADVGSLLRVRVTATNAEGEQTVASNPTAVVVGAPVNTSIPLVGGTALVGSLATVQPGSWTGRQPISFSYVWLRCNNAGGECAAIGALGRSYRFAASDVNHKIRVNVTARNAVGSATVLSSESAVVAVPLPAGAIRLGTGEISIPATSVPSDQRLIVSRVAFTPNPVTTRARPLTVRVRVMDSRNYVVRDALVFVRATPRVTTGGRLLTATDGWVTFRLQPLARFPLRKQGNVQFFVKAYRSGDPSLGGVAGYRLVQVRTAAGDS
ncbi:MAG: hypothetical protein H0U30_07510 [Actinobacteria bacterium]|nr:hypothetical protein [Actinomycetota bacterium]